jgi:TRAP-type mannitol/chloroaromatic compound transport system permease small subunit
MPCATSGTSRSTSSHALGAAARADSAAHSWRRLLLIPFCLIITYYGYFFALTAWNTGEGSAHGGLQSRWIIKACIPLAFGLLAAAGVVRVIAGLAALCGPCRPAR